MAVKKFLYMTSFGRKLTMRLVKLRNKPKNETRTGSNTRLRNRREKMKLCS